MTNDILPLDDAAFGEIGSRLQRVAANTSGVGTGTGYLPSFRAGEPVSKTLGNEYVTTLAAIGTGSSAKPVVGTDFLAGVAISGQGGLVSTETDTADGLVYVVPLVPNVVYIGNADNPTTFGYNPTTGVITQDTYDDLVGFRVLIKMSAGEPPVFTILAADSATSGLVVENLDITKYPGKVAFSLRNALSYTA